MGYPFLVNLVYSNFEFHLQHFKCNNYVILRPTESHLKLEIELFDFLKILPISASFVINFFISYKKRL